MWQKFVEALQSIKKDENSDMANVDIDSIMANLWVMRIG